MIEEDFEARVDALLSGVPESLKKELKESLKKDFMEQCKERTPGSFVECALGKKSVDDLGECDRK